MDETRHEKDVHPKVKKGLSVFKKGGKFLIIRNYGAARVGEYNRVTWFYWLS